MADYEIPPDLLQKRVDFVTAQERLSAPGRATPWLEAQAKCRDLAVEIQEHAWWGTVDNRQKAEKALRQAAEKVVQEAAEKARREAADETAASGQPD
ncbi:hypothetical protein [Nonomuraea sp. NPDC049129]|uniref:hypothetical protein n=1 Tax=Nonomuraea sp. NPDC049129 TaxID=3155272 RepID=UPI00340F08E3